MSYQNNPILFDCNTFSIYDVPIVKEYNLMTMRIDKNEYISGMTRHVQLTSRYYPMHALAEVSLSIYVMSNCNSLPIHSSIFLV